MTRYEIHGHGQNGNPASEIVDVPSDGSPVVINPDTSCDLKADNERLRLTLTLAHKEANRLRTQRDEARASLARLVAHIAAAYATTQGKP